MLGARSHEIGLERMGGEQVVGAPERRSRGGLLPDLLDEVGTRGGGAVAPRVADERHHRRHLVVVQDRAERRHRRHAAGGVVGLAVEGHRAPQAVQHRFREPLLAAEHPRAADERRVDHPQALAVRLVAGHAVGLALVDGRPCLVGLEIGAGEVRGGHERHDLPLRLRQEAARAGLVDLVPEVLDGGGGDRRVAHLRGKHFFEQRVVAHAVLLVQPEGLEQMMGLGLVVGIEALHPGLRGGDHVLRGTAGQFDPRAVPHAVHRRLQVLEERLDRLPVDRDGLLQRSPGRGEPEDAAVRVVAVGVADVVLHVADDHVVPVGDVERAVGAHDRVGGPEVAVLALEERPHRGAPDLARLPARVVAVAVEVILLHAEEPDRVADEEVLLHVVGEVRRRDDLVGRHGPELLLEELEHLEALPLGPHLERVAPGAVVGVAVAPAVERGAVRVGRVAGVRRDREPPRVEAIHAGRADREVLGPRRLVVVDEEDAALPVDAAVRAVDQVVGRMVRVGGVEPLEQDRAHVGPVVAVGVLEVEQVGPGGDDHAAAPELEAERVVHVREDDPFVGPAVAVGVLEDHQAVVHRLERLPLGIRVPARRPEPPLRVHLELHGVGKVGKLHLRREHVEREALRHLDLREALLGREVLDASLLLLARALAAATHVRLHRHRRRHVGVVDRERPAGGGRPDRRVAIRRHHVEHHEFVPKHVGVALAIHEREPRAVAPDVVAVGRAKPVVPVPVLVGDGRTHLPEVRVGRHGRAEERLRNDVGEPAVAGVVQVAAVEREPLGAAGEELERRCVEIDERGVGLLGGEPRGGRVGGEVRVVERAVGQVRVAGVLEGDRAEEDEPHLFALLGAEGPIVRDRLDELLPVGVGPGRAGVRLVVAEEHEDHARIHEIEIGGIGDEALLARTHPHGVARHAEIAEPHIEPGQLFLKHGLHPRGVLHPVGESIAVDRHRVVLLEDERGRDPGRDAAGGQDHRDEAGHQESAGRGNERVTAMHRRRSRRLGFDRPGGDGHRLPGERARSRNDSEVYLR